MQANKPNLVLGTAWRLTVDEVGVFVESLRRHYSGLAMLVISSRDSRDLVQYLLARDVVPVFFDCPHWMVMHIQLARYVRYGEVLRGLGIECHRVLLSDVSDVVFQADPFVNLPDGELLCFAEEAGRRIGQCEFNRRWVQEVYGTQGLERVADCQIYCSGTTIGSQRAIVQYIDLLLTQATPEVLANVSKVRGHDQGIHNFLLHTGALPQARMIDNGRHVYTLGHVPDGQVHIGEGGAILTAEGLACPIVQQYNYKPPIDARVRAAFGLGSRG